MWMPVFPQLSFVFQHSGQTGKEKKRGKENEKKAGQEEKGEKERGEMKLEKD